ncbi:3-keto-5-aminohexanoate cleavage protein [Salsuginibacillus kocurii]|uniref:3-keto-5-aminohexanoate cleavage protein n=1 Tax=Salsuginibacillus kocurii TaxID=427078 RepID=UPI000381DB58|nr:3-keto-5-aminohexanoate cleavage protein [Salsuginibacillus kocurii]
MRNKVIITSALTGAGETTKKNANVPVTPQEIADDAIAAARAGATVAHIHVRDPETGEVSHDPALFGEVVERVREKDQDVVLNMTAGGGGDWVPSPEDPTRGGPGTDIQTPAERHEPVGLYKPEICTLDCGSLNFGESVYLNPADWLIEQAQLVQKSGVKPELECFDTGQIRLANHLINEGYINGTPLFQFCLGIPWGADADTETMQLMKSKIPEQAEWAAFGIGRLQIPMAVQSALLGGHVRVGLEDNLYLEKGVKASNEALVDKVVNILQQLGIEPMTPAEARTELDLYDPHAKG